MYMTRILQAAVLSLSVVAGQAGVITTTANGANAADIQASVDAFRAALGGVNNGVNAFAGGTGRREVNWDAVPNGFSAPNALPGGFFNQNSQRGLRMTPGAGGSLMVSDNAAGGNGAGVEFENLNVLYPRFFTTFSQQKLFGTLGTNTYDLDFFVPLNGNALPGSQIATVSGFGIVFTNVALAGTQIQAFDINNVLLATLAAPIRAEGLSFASIRVDGATNRIARVRVTQGSGGLGPNDTAQFNAVAADDFIYGEPLAAAAIPEPATCALMAGGLLALAALRRRR